MSELTVLVAEDSSQLRKVFVQQLQEYYHVRGVGSGDALLEALNPAVDAVVCDWKVGGTQKSELLDAIERAASDPAVIVISGVATRQDVRTLGAAECLEKPIQIDTLRDAIHNALAEQSGVSPTRAQTSSKEADKREAVATDLT